MSKVLIKISVSFAIFTILSLFFNFVLDNGIAKTNLYEYKKFNDLKNGNIDCDLLIIGSSRARNHYNTEIIDSILKVKTHNIGILASFLDYNLMTLKLYLQFNKKPKAMILDLSIYSMQDIDEIRNVNQYVGIIDNENVFKTLVNKSNTIWFYRYIPLFKYVINREALQVAITSILDKDESPKTIPNGYSNTDKKFDGPEYNKFIESLAKGKETIKCESKRSNDLKNIIEICKKDNINLFIVFSPSYELFFNNISNKEEIIKMYEEIAKDNNVIFWDYSNNDICKNVDLFFDCDHLNNKGAKLFSSLLANDILKVGFNK